MQAIVFLKELQKKRLISEVSEGSGDWIRTPTTSGFDSTTSHGLHRLTNKNIILISFSIC